MTSYLVLPHMRVQGANMYNAAFLMGGPPVLAAWFMTHALGRKMDMADHVLSMAFVLHSQTPLGDLFYAKAGRAKRIANAEHSQTVLGGSFYVMFYPQLRRGAAYTFGPSRNGTDYSKNKQALSLQPVARAHMEVSLVVGIRDLGATEGINSLLVGGRLAGGAITSMAKPCLHRTVHEALEHVRTGYVVRDRRDLLEREGAGNRAEQFVAALGHKPAENDALGWLSATCLGYAATTPFEKRAGAREGYEHAFAEPLIGLVQYVPIRRCLGEDMATQSLWRSEWTTPDLFRIYQD